MSLVIKRSILETRNFALDTCHNFGDQTSTTNLMVKKLNKPNI